MNPGNVAVAQEKASRKKLWYARGPGSFSSWDLPPRPCASSRRPTSPPPEWLWIPHTFHIFGWAGREVATIVFVTQLAGPAKRATAVTLSISTGMAGMMVGSFLMGTLSDMYGYPVMFRIISAITFLGLLFLVFVVRRQKNDLA